MLKKTSQADIRNLFQKFGGDTGSYKEIQQDYVSEKAQQSWPIVTAMEKERVSAPMLKAAAGNQRPRPAEPVGAKTGSFVAQAAKPVAAVRSDVASNTGSFMAMPASAQRAAPSVVPVRESAVRTEGLFARSSAPVERVAPASSVKNLFSAMASPVNEREVGRVQQVAPVQVNPPSANDSLNAVFSRLTQPQNVVPASAPDNGLRGILGFLKK